VGQGRQDHHSRLRMRFAFTSADCEKRSVPEYPLPVPSSVLKALAEQNSPLRDLASLSRKDAIGKIRGTWASIEEPVFRRLADAILAAPLKCLSMWNDEAYLTFQKWENGLERIVSIISPKNELPLSFREVFPVEGVPGLETFLTYFGGLRDGELRVAGSFIDPKLPLIVPDEPIYDWGEMREWEGSLPLYQNSSGDCILISPDRAIGVWFHENVRAGLDQSPCSKIDYTFMELMEHFVGYMQLPPNSEERQGSPFHYCPRPSSSE
jgi:hypothetical protein